MGRSYRWFSDEKYASYHIISKVAGGDLILNGEDKEYFTNLMFKLAKGYYVDIISYTVMSNHFHILLSNRMDEAANASKEALVQKYKSAFGKNAEHPEGSFIRDTFEIEYDEDGGIERLRRRLGSVSRFVQDLKQRFSRWYNKKYDRNGFLWGNRFKGIAISKGEAELICSAYIDLNSIRAGIVKKPEDYRWSSIGLRVRNQRKAKSLLKTIILIEENRITYSDSGKIKQRTEKRESELGFSDYKSFLYDSGRVARDGSAEISEKVYMQSTSLFKRLGFGDSLLYRYRNLSEGIAFGTYDLISSLQERLGRRFIKPRKIIEKQEDAFYSTRKLTPI